VEEGVSLQKVFSLKRYDGNTVRSIDLLIDPSMYNYVGLYDMIHFIFQWVHEGDFQENIWISLPSSGILPVSFLAELIQVDKNYEMESLELLQQPELLRLVQSGVCAPRCLKIGRGGASYLPPPLPAHGGTTLILKSEPLVATALLHGCPTIKTVAIHDAGLYVENIPYARALAANCGTFPALTTLALCVSDLHPSTRAYWNSFWYLAAALHILHVHTTLDSFLRDMLGNGTLADAEQLFQGLLEAYRNMPSIMTFSVDEHVVGRHRAMQLCQLAGANVRRLAIQKQAESSSPDEFAVWLTETLVEVEQDADLHLYLVREFLVRVVMADNVG
jgi:hypothetical protein